MSEPERSLSLFSIDETLHQLIDLRDEVETDEERAAVDQQIVEWGEKFVAKVDPVRNWIRHCDMRETASLALAKEAADEAVRQKQHAATWANRRDRMKQICMAIMEARGVKNLEGQSGRLRIQAAGGKRALEITRADLVPDSLCAFTLRLTYDEWHALFFRAHSPLLPMFQRDANRDAIRAALEARCDRCQGSGKLIAIDNLNDFYDCDDCHGTGLGAVPGARLAERGQTLRVD